MVFLSGKRTIGGNPSEGADLSDSLRTPSSQAPAPDYASGSKSPMGSTSGGTEVPWEPEGALKPGTTTENQLASSTLESQSSSPNRVTNTQWAFATADVRQDGISGQRGCEDVAKVKER